MFGEWVWAKHSIHYGCDCEKPCKDVGPSLSELTGVDDDRAYFQVFGVYDRELNLWLSWPETEQVADALGFPTTPVIHVEDDDDAATFETEHEARRELIAHARRVIDEDGEGIVVRKKFPFLPCISQWWYTPIHVHDEIREPIERVLESEAKKSRLQVYRRGDEWFCSFTVEYDTVPEGETPIGVDIGERHILAAHALGTDESMLVSGKEARYVRRKYRSLRDSLQEAGALRARNRVGNKEHRRIRDLNHTLSRRLVDFADQFENPVIWIETLESIRDRTEWSGVHSWHFHQLQTFITYKAEQAGIRVETVDPAYTSQDCFHVVNAVRGTATTSDVIRAATSAMRT